MTDKAIAQTILDQLGWRMFGVMTGAKDMIALKDGIRFRIGKNVKSVNLVEVRLNGRDLYDVEFMRIRAHTVKTVSKSLDVYADRLVATFEEATGLATSLGRRAA